jgi:hypothetical protein
VHSDLDHHGFIPTLVAMARQKGVAGYVGDGANRWPAGHTLDAAHLYRLAVESAPAGTRLHAVGDEGIPFREIAATIARHLDVPTASIPAGEAAGHFGFLGTLVQLDNPTSSALTRELMSWKPEHPGLIEDIDGAHYSPAPPGPGHAQTPPPTPRWHLHWPRSGQDSVWQRSSVVACSSLTLIAPALLTVTTD